MQRDIFRSGHGLNPSSNFPLDLLTRAPTQGTYTPPRSFS